ncbi:hypothetical protein VOLCADRAFT_99285 [Volvox carteri f. nagariensis]|uniref:Regulator of MON1-CCZ1 complex N-terminal domain-containing protein n=1 Tax=Volvox carteri f. nagariensis TaxID=3068 RepID=D8UHF0_VOLCA|nr:uncharacterized protein VOLCADRAFT_99285 [Volvox carteri f. nagariensis]EFJ40813.1 hypothetical protein VOLCADRAFT_99285 [Volvox carteri f. nagariensis]|eukprot:XP_002958082.1 hypothetical protein VOLCADRAFT_99285 [Volvox carteri f. nagariensis]
MAPSSSYTGAAAVVPAAVAAAPLSAAISDTNTHGGGGGGVDVGNAGGGGDGSGGGTLHHVVAIDQGLHLEPETLSYWGYDDGTSTLLVVKGGLVFAYDLSPGVTPGSPEQLRWTFPLSDGPAVRALRLSLDGGLLAIQRSGVMIECVELATGNVFVQARRGRGGGTDRGRSEVSCFFFTELEGADVVLVTPAGLELLEFVPRRLGLRMRERHRPLRCTLMGAAPAGAAALVAGSPVAAAAVATPPARVTADSLRLLKVYGRVYCAHMNRRALRLELYRFYTDTVVLQHTYELFSPNVDLAVVDSVIIVVAAAAAAQGTDSGGAAAPAAAAPQSGVAMLFDVAATTFQPIANPLPLRPLRHGVPPLLPPEADAAAAAPAAVAASGGGGKRRWEYLAPNVVLDRETQTAYRLAVNLPAVAESCSDPAVLVGFLQRRKGAAPAPALLPQPKALLMWVVRNALQERVPMTTVRAIFDDLCAGYAAALDRELAAEAVAAAAASPPPSAAGAAGGSAAAVPPPPPPPPASAVPMPQYVTADELSQGLFRWLHDEEVVDAPYLQAALWEYMCAAFTVGIPLPRYLPELSVEILLQQSQEGQVLQLLYGQKDYVAVEVVRRLMAAPAAAAAAGAAAAEAAGPSSGSSAAVACGGGTGTNGTDGAAAAAASARGPLCPQLGMDALARAALAARYEPVGGGVAAAAASGDAAVYVEALLAAGEVLRAARVMRRYRVSRPSVKEFLAAVGARGDEAMLAAVYRTFQCYRGPVGDEQMMATTPKCADELLASYPKFDLAARKLLPALQTPQQALAAGV